MVNEQVILQVIGLKAAAQSYTPYAPVSVDPSARMFAYGDADVIEEIVEELGDQAGQDIYVEDAINIGEMTVAAFVQQVMTNVKEAA